MQKSLALFIADYFLIKIVHFLATIFDNLFRPSPVESVRQAVALERWLCLQSTLFVTILGFVLQEIFLMHTLTGSAPRQTVSVPWRFFLIMALCVGAAWMLHDLKTRYDPTASASPADALVGRWVSADWDWGTLEFRDDGTVYIPAQNASGKYRLFGPANDRLRIDLYYPNSNMNPVLYSIALDGDTLKLGYKDAIFSFRRQPQ
jgi:hypothetical protein